MSFYTVTIQWRDSRETIFIDSELPPKKGERIETYEKWTGYPNPVRYVVDITDAQLDGSTYRFSLRYAEKNNQEIAAHGILWGTTELTLDLVSNTATASWHNEPKDASVDGPGKVKLVKHELTADDLGMETILRRKRLQDMLKQALLLRSSCCELSGEGAQEALDAAHIVEVKDAGGFGANNGLLLRADLHRLFDAGLLTIFPDGRITLSPDLDKSSNYWKELPSWEIRPEALSAVHAALAMRLGNRGSFA